MAHINETRLVCVKLPANLCPFTSEEQPRYLCIVFDERHGDSMPGSPAQQVLDPQVLNHAGKHAGLPCLPRYEAVSLACSQRAVDTLDGTLRVAGKRIEPEAYLRRWRKALEEAVTVDQLRGHRLQLVVEFILDPAAPCLSRRPNWINAPFPNLAALLLSRGGLVELAHPRDAELHPGWGQLSLDLSHPDAARDAWWLDDGLDACHGECRLRIQTLRTSAALAGAASTSELLADATAVSDATRSHGHDEETESLS